LEKHAENEHEQQQSKREHAYGPNDLQDRQRKWDDARGATSQKNKALERQYDGSHETGHHDKEHQYQ